MAWLFGKRKSKASVTEKLRQCIFSDDVYEARQLLAKGANATLVLADAISVCKPNFVRLLIDAGADIEHRVQGRTALHQVINMGDSNSMGGVQVELVRVLVSVRAELDARTENSDKTPLELALYRKNTQLVPLLGGGQPLGGGQQRQTEPRRKPPNLGDFVR